MVDLVADLRMRADALENSANEADHGKAHGLYDAAQLVAADPYYRLGREVSTAVDDALKRASDAVANEGGRVKDFCGDIDIRFLQDDLGIPQHKFVSLLVYKARRGWWGPSPREYDWIVTCSCGANVTARGGESLDVLLNRHRGRP